jgi:hypothetical protein
MLSALVAIWRLSKSFGKLTESWPKVWVLVLGSGRVVIKIATKRPAHPIGKPPSMDRRNRT